jgi:hypothetical protein
VAHSTTPEQIMALVPLTERQKTLIVNNVVKAVADITKLNRTGYGFLYLASGFIAYYNLAGFKEQFKTHNLKRDILANHRQNQWLNFRPGDNDYDYYKSKADVYNRIVEAIK